MAVTNKTFQLAICAQYTGWLRKVIHCRESSLNRMKNRQPG